MRFLTVLCLAPLLIVGGPSLAQYNQYADPRAAANPCEGANDRNLHRYTGGRLFYDGIKKLERAPARFASLPAEFIGPYKAGCVLFRITLREERGTLKLDDHRYLIQTPTRSTGLTPRYVDAATRVLQGIDDFSILPGNPHPNVSYVVAIPLWEQHGFYNPSSSSVIGRDLEALGYYDAELVGESADAVAYHIHTDRNSEYYVVVKSFADDEPILDFVDTGRKTPYDQPIHELGPKTMAEFDALIKRTAQPNPRSTLTQFEVRYYAKDVNFDYPNTPATIRAAVHPETHRPVPTPVAIAHVFSERQRDGSIRWIPGRPDGAGVDNYGLPNTLAEVRHAFDEENLTYEERVARAQAEEAKRREALAEEDAELDQHAEQRRAGRNRSDPANPLLPYGYEDASLLLADGDTTYFTAEVRHSNIPTPRRYVVALHDIRESDDMIDLTVKPGERYEYSEARIRYLQGTILPLAKTVWPDHASLTVHHHVKGQFVDDSEQFRRFGRPSVTYEQPLLVEELTGLLDADGLMRPSYDTRGLDLQIQVRFGPDFANSVADARRYRDAERTAVAKARDERDMTLAERSAKRRAERLEQERARPSGWVHKTERYWLQFYSFYIPSKTFAGEFSAYRINVQFPDHFVRFVSMYSTFCQAHIVKPIERTVIWDEITLQGGFETDRERHVSKIYVAERVFGKFEEYEIIRDTSMMGRIFETIAGRLTGRDADGTQMLQTIGTTIRDELQLSLSWRRFFDTNTCSSATMYQMKENLYRAALGEPSLQAANIPVPNAASESEPLVVPRDQMTFFDACHDYHAYEKVEWCSCLTAGAENNLTPAERRRYTADFSLFDREALTYPDPLPPVGHRFWTLNEFVGACRN